MNDLKEEIRIPDGVLDESAYLELVRKKKELAEDPRRFFYAASADNEKFDLFTAYAHLQRKLDESKVSTTEQEAALKLCKQLASERGKLNALQYKAFRGSNSSTNSPNVVLEKRKEELLTLFGKFHTVKEVHKIVVEDWGIDISIKSIETFRSQNLGAIQGEQDKYLRTYDNIRLVHKKSRLDEYTGLYEDRKNKYLTTKNREDYKLLLQTLECIRKEIEGDKLVVEGLEINIQQTINVHIQQNLLKEINIGQLVLARVANRLGISPIYLMSRLEKSHYAKFTGFSNPDQDPNTAVISYPSSQVYDFNEIQAKYESNNEEVVQDVEIQEVRREDGIKLLQALLMKKKELIQAEGRVLEQGIGTAKFKGRERKKK